MDVKTIDMKPCVVIFSKEQPKNKILAASLSALRPDWYIRPIASEKQLVQILSEERINCLVFPVNEEKEAIAINTFYNSLNPDHTPPALIAVPLEKRSAIRQALSTFESSSIYTLHDDLENITTALQSLLKVHHVEQELRRVNLLLTELIEERSRTLHESSEQLRFLSEFSSDAIFEVEKDQSTGVSTFVGFNNTACTWLGYSSEELLEIPFSHLLEPLETKKITDILKTVSHPQEFRFDLTIKARSGEQLLLNVVGRAFESETGLRMIAIAHKKAEPEVEGTAVDPEDEYESLVSHIGQLMYDGNVDTQHMIWNGAAELITGFSLQTLTSEGMRGWRQRILSDDYPRVMESINTAIERLAPYNVEYGYLHQSGEIRYLEDHGVVLPDHTGSVNRIMGTIKDVTEKRLEEEARQRMQREIEHSQRLESLGVLAGGIAHDFNNILAGIIGLTDLALREIPSDSFAFEDLNEALRAAHRAKELVQQILAFSRQGGREKLPIYPHIVTREVIRLLRASLPASIEIIDYIDPHSGSALANAAQLHQVITNFSTNAAQAIKNKQGVIEFRVQNVEIDRQFSEKNPKLVPGSYIKISVTDNGHGMAPSILSRVFDPFFTTKGPGEGTGMGLSVAHGIITDHGGTIVAQSKLKKGSTFEAYLPRLKEEAESEDSQLVSTGDDKKTHILFIDDDEAVRRFASSALPRLGFEIILCESAEEALQVLAGENQKIDLVITDQIMPCMTGTELVAVIRKDHRDLPVILFTGFSQDLSMDELTQLGIHSVLRKPIIVRELLATIRKALNSKNKR